MAACGTEEAEGSCVPASCCSSVTWTATDPTFLQLYFGTSTPITGVFLPHPTTPAMNDRAVYVWPQIDYCLWYDHNAWRLSSCANLGTKTYSLATQEGGYSGFWWLLFLPKL